MFRTRRGLARLALALTIPTAIFAGMSGAYGMLPALGVIACVAAWRGVMMPASVVAPIDTSSSVAPANIVRDSTSALVEALLQEGRSALLLRKLIVDELSTEQRTIAHENFQAETALILGGATSVAKRVLPGFESQLEDERHELIFQVQPFFLDRDPVTNRRYAAFIDAGGYSQWDLWEPEILPALSELVDRTGLPGPRFWSTGTFPPGQAEHPVTGVNWYEALAFARWCGKRLPSDAEWVNAAAAPIALNGDVRRQRPYPWGEHYESRKANLWASGSGGTCAVDEFAAGTTSGEIRQLAGNVWEWTQGDFEELLEPEIPHAEWHWKTIRGGAFDTYFETQARNDFAAGESPLARKHNVGFRCAASWADIATSVDEPTSTVELESQTQSCEASL